MKTCQFGMIMKDCGHQFAHELSNDASIEPREASHPLPVNFQRRAEAQLGKGSSRWKVDDKLNTQKQPPLGSHGVYPHQI